MPYFVYILQSVKDGIYYVGQTNSLSARLKEHNSGKSVYTKKNMPWRLALSEELESRRDALKREKEIKNWKSKKMIGLLIEKTSST